MSEKVQGVEMRRSLASAVSVLLRGDVSFAMSVSAPDSLGQLEKTAAVRKNMRPGISRNTGVLLSKQVKGVNFC